MKKGMTQIVGVNLNQYIIWYLVLVINSLNWAKGIFSFSRKLYLKLPMVQSSKAICEGYQLYTGIGIVTLQDTHGKNPVDRALFQNWVCGVCQARGLLTSVQSSPTLTYSGDVVMFTKRWRKYGPSGCAVPQSSFDEDVNFGRCKGRDLLPMHISGLPENKSLPLQRDTTMLNRIIWSTITTIELSHKNFNVNFIVVNNFLMVGFEEEKQFIFHSIENYLQTPSTILKMLRAIIKFVIINRYENKLSSGKSRFTRTI